MLTTFVLFLFAFVLIWVGSGLAVNAITKIAHSLRMSSFFVSFFILGLFTSITEIMVGINSVLENKPEIFVGNLIGSSVVVFLLIIPWLAVVGKGVKLNHSFEYKDIVSAVVVVGFPALLAIDNRISVVDALVCVIVYGYFLYMQERKTRSLGKLLVVNIGNKTIYLSFAKILIAIVLVFAGSNILVENTTRIATYLGVSSFVVSLLIISVGTNIPEISIALRAIVERKKDIAFGNYIGSASLNTLEMGILGLIGFKTVPANGSNFSILLFLFGLALFIFFIKSKTDVSRREGIMLLGCYFAFVLTEIFTGPGWVV